MSQIGNSSEVINSLNSSNSSINTKTTSSSVGGELGKDAFLQLLVTQMKYQDPLNPMDNSEYLAQLAQFSSLEQMENLNTQFEQHNGHSMIGKYGYAPYVNPNTNETEYVEGMIEKTTFNNGVTYVVIDNKDIPIDSVQILEEAISSEDIAKLQQLQASNAFSLVGKYIHASEYNQENDSYTDIEGVVNQVNLENGQFYLIVNDKKVNFNTIYQVSNDKPEEPLSEGESV